MLSCWARSEGPCKGGISGEHIVSESILAKRVTVRGMHWCGEPVTLPASVLVSNMLCRHHNSSLSPLDSEAGKVRKALAEAARLIEVRGQFQRHSWSPVRLSIRGDLLERWFIKTLINMAWSDLPQRTWALGPGDPPEALVNWVYQGNALKGPMGLYGAVDLGLQLRLNGPLMLGATLVFRDPYGLAGGFFDMLGLRWILWLSPEPLPVAEIPLLQAGWDASTPVFHLRQYRFNLHDRLSHVLHFRWSTGA
jgi:hypothetical protein